MIQISRRAVLAAGPGAGLAILGLPRALGAAQPPTAPAAPAATPAAAPAAPPPGVAGWPGFPHQEARLVREVVGAAHRDEARVRDLVQARPALVHAWWDWGFGDWESPLGAAAHTGRRNIAEYLISRGARVDIFAAAMLGWTDVLRGLIASSPGVQGAMGPHGINLLAHARAGGAPAAEAAAYLEQAGGADAAPALAAISLARREQLAGSYAHRPEEGLRFSVRAEKERLEFLAPGGTPLRLHHLGSDEFYPAGVPTVRLRFEGPPDAPTTGVTIHDHDRRVRARRTTG